MIVTYSRGGGWRPPRDRELLEISDNGEFTMWRSVSWTAPIGRFAGQLDATTQATLERQLEAVVQAGSIELTPPPDAAFEGIVIKEGAGQATKASAGMGSNDEPEGAWGILVKHLRQLLHDLTRYPRAAIALEVDNKGRKARLAYQGEEPLRLDLSDLAVRVVLWEPDDVTAGDWTGTGRHSDKMADIEAGPGWSLDLPFDHGLKLSQDRKLGAFVTFKAYDGKLPVPVKITSPRSGSE